MPSQEKIEKEICDWTKAEISVHFEQLKKIVSKPAYVCTKCGRAANRKKWLCHAKRLRSE